MAPRRRAAKASDDPRRGRLATLAASLGRLGPSLAIVAALAVVLRAVHLVEVHDTPLFLKLQTDPFEYHHWALRILEGDWAGRSDPVFYQGPLYPYLLALIYRFAGPSPLGACAVQVVLSSASAVLVVLLGRRVGGPWVGLVAGLLCAGYGMLVFHASLLLAETLIVFLHLAMLLALDSALRRRSLWRWGAAGLLLGLAAVARGNVLLFGPVIALWLGVRWGVRQWRRWLPALGSLAAGTLLAIAPVTAHNRLVGDDLVLLTWNVGTNLFIGNNAASDGIYLRDAVYQGRPMGLSVRDQRLSYPEVAKKELGRDDLLPSEISAFWTGRALAEVADDPARWLGLVANKLRYYLNGYEVPNVRNYYFSQRFSALLRLPLVSFGLVLPLALVGIALRARSWRRHGWLLGYVAAHLLALLAFFVNDRYRLVVAPVLCVLGAETLVWLARQAMARDLGRLGLAATGGAAAALVATAPVTHTSFRADLLNLGNAYRDLGQLDQAVASYDEAIELSAGFYYAHFKRAEVLSRLGRKEEARAGAERALAMARRNGDTLNARRIRSLLDSLGNQGGKSGRVGTDVRQCGEPRAKATDECASPRPRNDGCGP